LFIQELGKIPGKISVIPINKENYISVSKKIKSLSGNSFEIRFLDTYRFMPSSLDTLVSNLVDDQMNNVKSFFCNDILNKFKKLFNYNAHLVMSRGVWTWYCCSAFLLAGHKVFISCSQVN